MTKLIVIADDFTGALDTGVQFAAVGAAVRVVTNYQYDISDLKDQVQVVVVDAETRHLDSKTAYDRVYEITAQAVKLNIPYIYKKTDSALRGNIGSELQAVLDACEGKTEYGSEISFAPAFPKMKRTTENGIHYIEGQQVAESVFGKDPFEPVTESELTKLIALQSECSTVPVDREHQNTELNAKRAEKTIVAYDAKTDEDLSALAKELLKAGKIKLMAGCAGFASVLPKLLEIHGQKPEIPELDPHFMVVCGSVNPITRRQLDVAEQNGFKRVVVPMEIKLSEDCMDHKEQLEQMTEIFKSEPRCILDTNDSPGKESAIEYASRHNLSVEDVRQRISLNLGRILKWLVEEGVGSTMLITGGDCLLGFMNQIGIYELSPICEVDSGSVLSGFTYKGKHYNAISKSGGFGAEDLMVKLAQQINR